MTNLKLNYTAFELRINDNTLNHIIIIILNFNVELKFCIFF